MFSRRLHTEGRRLREIAVKQPELQVRNVTIFHSSSLPPPPSPTPRATSTWSCHRTPPCQASSVSRDLEPPLHAHAAAAPLCVSHSPLPPLTGELDSLRESLTRLQSSANQALADLSEKEVHNRRLVVGHDNNNTHLALLHDNNNNTALTQPPHHSSPPPPLPPPSRLRPSCASRNARGSSARASCTPPLHTTFYNHTSVSFIYVAGMLLLRNTTGSRLKCMPWRRVCSRCHAHTLLGRARARDVTAVCACVRWMCVRV